jgi:hypothetical protein
MMMKRARMMAIIPNRREESSQLIWFQDGIDLQRLFLATRIMTTRLISGVLVASSPRPLTWFKTSLKRTLTTGTYFKELLVTHCLQKRKRKMEIKHKSARMTSW